MNKFKVGNEVINDRRTLEIDLGCIGIVQEDDDAPFVEWNKGCSIDDLEGNDFNTWAQNEDYMSLKKYDLFCKECDAITVGFCICDEPNLGEGEL